MSAACSTETAGCQTLKGTGAEFNASCQGSLMWLSPPARAGIVKLSGAGKDAQTALRDAPSLSPLQEHRSGRNRGWEASTISTKGSVCTCGCVRTCAHVWIYVELTLFPCCSSELLWLILERKLWITRQDGQIICVNNHIQGAADSQLIDLLFFNALCLSVWSNFGPVPSVCTYLCLPFSE